jgi:hypothetical protein
VEESVFGCTAKFQFVAASTVKNGRHESVVDFQNPEQPIPAIHHPF